MIIHVNAGRLAELLAEWRRAPNPLRLCTVRWLSCGQHRRCKHKPWHALDGEAEHYTSPRTRTSKHIVPVERNTSLCLSHVADIRLLNCVGPSLVILTLRYHILPQRRNFASATQLLSVLAVSYTVVLLWCSLQCILWLRFVAVVLDSVVMRPNAQQRTTPSAGTLRMDVC